MIHRPSRETTSRKPPNAFTLIELLVVIAVIALLMAILLPALRKGKQLAQRVRCGSNLRQLAMGWGLYLEDNDGSFPKGRNLQQYYGGWRGTKDQGPRILNRYLRLDPNLPNPNSAKVFHCPADHGGVLSRPGVKVFTYIGTSYQTNFLLVGPESGGISTRLWYSSITSDIQLLEDGLRARVDTANRNTIDNHSQLILIADYSWYNQWNPNPDWMSDEEKEIGEWHGRADHHCVAFLDGHSAFTEIRKGIWVDGHYTIIPWRNLHPLARKIQGE